MPGQFLTHAERDRLSHFPKEISNNDLITYFTLSPADLYQIPPKSASHNRLGFALQLCTLRFLGFSPDEITQTPISVVAYIANQLNVDPIQLTHYGKRDHTRTDHLQKIQRYLGFKKASTEDFISLEQWLIERALEHDKPTYLLQITCEKLLKANIVRPGITVLERMVITARQKAQEHTYKNLSFLLTENRKAFLDKIAVYNESKACSPLVWLRKGATSNTPEEILNAIDKLSFLKEAGVHKWNISSLNPNRRRFLAQLGRKISAQHLQRANSERRYPILIAFLAQTLEDVTDELIDLYDRCIGGCYNRSKQDLTKFRLSKAKTVDEKLRMLEQLSHIIVDQTITDLELRKHIYTHIPESVLRATIDDCSKIIRPKSDKYYDFLINRYGYIRQFAPKFIEALNFCSNSANTSLLEAIHLLQQLNSEGKRKVPDEASLEFIPHSWKSYLYDGNGSISRRTYEICTLWELRSALKGGSSSNGTKTYAKNNINNLRAISVNYSEIYL